MTVLRTWRTRFRDWRRDRPFWGGALLAAAGVELLVAPAAQSLILPIDLIIYAGIAGISGHFIGALLIGVGVLSWFQPAQNPFFGLVGIALALVSFVTSNFGGFVIGMLLGIVGGSLVFAWGPRAREERAERRAARRRRKRGESEDPGGDEDDKGDEGHEEPAPAGAAGETPADPTEEVPHSERSPGQGPAGAGAAAEGAAGEGAAESNGPEEDPSGGGKRSPKHARPTGSRRRR